MCSCCSFLSLCNIYRGGLLYWGLKRRLESWEFCHGMFLFSSSSSTYLFDKLFINLSISSSFCSWDTLPSLEDVSSSFPFSSP